MSLEIRESAATPPSRYQALGRVSVVLATYNERENIAKMIKCLCGLLDGADFEIVVVDDDSPDGTWQIVQDMHNQQPHIRLVHRTQERGLTSALQAGIDAASGAVVLWLDSDFQHPPEKIPEMLDAIEQGYDVAAASRYTGLDAGDQRLERGTYHLLRFHGFLSLALSRMLSLLLQMPFSDWTGSMIALKKSCLEGYRLDGDYGEYYIALIYHLLQRGYRVAEIPHYLDLRQEGESKTSADGYFGLMRLGTKYLRTVGKLCAQHYRPRD